MKKIDWINHLFNFVAVILGVFLAFYVSANAEKRKEKKELRAIIESLIDDLADDQATYREYQLPVNRNHLKSIEQITAGILSNQAGTISQYLTDLISLDNYSPTSVTYLSGTSSGKISLIDDLEIKKGLSYYFDVLSVEAQKKGEVQVDFFLHELLPWLINHVSLNDIDPESLLGNQVIANKLIIYQGFIENKTAEYEHIVEVAQSLESNLKDFLSDL